MSEQQHTPEPTCPASLPFAITAQEMKDLYRFHECAMDDEGYDVPKERMKRLAEIGLLRRVTANFYEHTVFGLSVINGDFDQATAIDLRAELAAAKKQNDELLKALDGLASKADELCRWDRRFDDVLDAADKAIASAKVGE